jgi:hypothetical protein
VSFKISKRKSLKKGKSTMPDFLLFDFFIIFFLISSTEDEESETLLVNSESLSDKMYFLEKSYISGVRFQVICRWRIGNYFFKKNRRQRKES